MTGAFRIVLASVLALVLAACGSSSSTRLIEPEVPPPPESFGFRVVHASPDSPRFILLANDQPALAPFDYGQSSGFLVGEAGSLDIAIEAIIPGGNQKAIDLPDTEFAANTEYTLLAVGKIGDETLDGLIISNPVSEIGAGNVRLQVVHAAPDAPAVDVYVTEPDAALTEADPLGSFAFGENLGPEEIPGGNYQVRVTLAGSTQDVVFDSGEVSLPAGFNLFIAALANTGAGASPIKLLVNSGIDAFDLLDVDTPADVRVVHAAPDAPPIDVILDDDTVNPLVPALAFPDFTSYVSLEAGEVNIKVVDTDGQLGALIDFDPVLQAGLPYTIIAAGLLSELGNEPLGLSQLILVDNYRRVATEARLRILHAAPSAGDVDLYISDEPGADISTLQPAYDGVEFRMQTGYAPLAGGDYEITVTTAGDPNEILIGPLPVTLVEGEIYTAIARDAELGGAPFGLILLDDF